MFRTVVKFLDQLSGVDNLHEEIEEMNRKRAEVHEKTERLKEENNRLEENRFAQEPINSNTPPQCSSKFYQPTGKGGTFGFSDESSSHHRYNNDGPGT